MNALDITRRLRALALDPDEYRINAGGAMVLYGLRRETHDLDIWCTKKLGNTLAERYGFETAEDGARRFVPMPDVEIYENMQPGETVRLNGIPVASLREVLAFKRKLNREKDQRDIAVLETALHAQESELAVSPMRPKDIPGCTDIYNFYVENTTVTLEEAPLTAGEFAGRMERIGREYPCLAARSGDGTVVGYAYLDMFNPRSAYRCTADLTLYIHPALRRGGVGQLLLDAIEPLARAQEIENIVSIITADNAASLAFHRKNGFAGVGTMRAVACKFGEYQDVSFLIKHLGKKA